MILLKIKTLLQLHKNMELQMVVMPQEMSTTLRLIWIKKRIGDYDFVENQDFVCVSQKNESQRAVRICGKSRLC